MNSVRNRAKISSTMTSRCAAVFFEQADDVVAAKHGRDDGKKHLTGSITCRSGMTVAAFF